MNPNSQPNEKGVVLNKSAADSKLYPPSMYSIMTLGDDMGHGQTTVICRNGAIHIAYKGDLVEIDS